jgi:hypothetical protein
MCVCVCDGQWVLLLLHMSALQMSALAMFALQPHSNVTAHLWVLQLQLVSSPTDCGRHYRVVHHIIWLLT